MDPQFKPMLFKVNWREDGLCKYLMDKIYILIQFVYYEKHWVYPVEPREVPHRLELGLEGWARRRVLPSRWVEKGTPSRGVKGTGVALKSLAFQPPLCSLTASQPGAWEAFLAAAPRETCHPLNHLGHSLFPPFVNWCQWVLWAKSCPTLILFDLCALPESPQGVAWPGAHAVLQSTAAARSVQMLVPPHSVRLPLLSAGPWGRRGGSGWV